MKTPLDRETTLYCTFLFFIYFISILFAEPVGNFPIGDDWQYSYPIKTWVENGKMEFKGIFAPNVLLQIVWGFLFCKIGGGFDFTWLRISTLIAGMIGLFYFFKILNQFSTPNKVFFLTALILMFNPLFYYLSFTFFTDIPFVALFILSIFYFIKYLQIRKSKFIILSIFFAITSFYIRQPGLLLIPTFSVFILIENRFSNKSLLVSSLFFLLAFAVYFSLEKWIKPALSISENFVPVGGQFYKAIIETPIFTGLEWIKKGIKTFVYLGFFSLPFFPFVWNKRETKKLFNKINIALITLTNTALLFALVYVGKTFPFGGNILFNCGLGSELLADVYTQGLPNVPRLPNWAMFIIQFISQFCASFLFILIINGYKKLHPLQKKVIVFLLLFNLIYLPVMSITSFFDRYLLPTIISFFIILSFFVEINKNEKSVWKFLPLIFICGFSLLATKDFMAWNRAKNKAFLYLTNMGVSIKEMDAGYEYNGFYNYHFPKEEKDGRSFWWVTDDKYMITFGPVNGYREIASFPYYRCLFFKRDNILVVQRTD